MQVVGMTADYLFQSGFNVHMNVFQFVFEDRTVVLIEFMHLSKTVDYLVQGFFFYQTAGMKHLGVGQAAFYIDLDQRLVVFGGGNKF